MNDLTVLARDLRSLDAIALARIEQGLVEHERESAIFGRSQTQTTLKLMSLTMLAAAPYRRLRQCAAEIERRKQALDDAGYKLRRAQLDAAEYRRRAENETDQYARDCLLLDADKDDAGIRSSRSYVEGALKDIAALIDVRDQIVRTHEIRAGWDEADAEAGEIEHHLRSIFRLAYRDWMHTGRISHAACEYAEQFGVHPAVLRRRVQEYVIACEEALSAGSAPTIESLAAWLDACHAAHKDDVPRAVALLGVTDLITRWGLYVDE